MTDTNAKDWNNYWQGRAGNNAATALVGVGVETAGELAAVWDGVFAGQPDETRVLDLACGAGSALKGAARAGLTALTGADISGDALAVLKREVPNATAVQTGADKTPFEDGSFDRIVSQFGFEYAGAAACAPEIARLLSSGGRFFAIAHMMDGGIHREVSTKVRQIDAILATDFAGRAKDLFTAAYAVEADETEATRAAFDAAASAFAPAQAALLTLAKQDGGQAAHLYQGVQHMYQRRAAYILTDTTGWLDNVMAEIAAFRGRMTSMSDAALNADAVAALYAALEDAGCKTVPAAPLQLNGADAAWILQASRACPFATLRAAR